MVFPDFLPDRPGHLCVRPVDHTKSLLAADDSKFCKFFRGRERQAAQPECIQHLKNCGISAASEGQRKNRNQRKCGTLPQLVECITEIFYQPIHELTRISAPSWARLSLPVERANSKLALRTLAAQLRPTRKPLDRPCPLHTTCFAWPVRQNRLQPGPARVRQGP